jgi:two-component system, OmpR family, phosphate regulon sensor histidine kinase PhoR
MSRRPLRWYLFPTYLLLSLLPLLALGWIGANLIHESYYSEAVTDLNSKARLVEQLLQIPLDAGQSAVMQRSCRGLGDLAAARVTIIRPDGVVLADSVAEPATMENHSNRPEVRDAAAGRVGTSSRFSFTLGHDMLYLAIPHTSGGRLTAIVRVAVPMTSLQHALNRFYRQLTAAGVVIALLTAAIAWFAARRISLPLEEIKQGADRFAQGDFTEKLFGRAYQEAAALADSLNQMASQLDERLRTVQSQQNELEAVLASMVEGVLAFDRDERLLNLNAAAGRLLSIDPHQARGRSLPEAVRNSQLQQLVTKALASEAPVEGDLLISGAEERSLQAIAATLRNAEGSRIGVLVVLHDVTRLLRLESLRREFVANVSHELKTPITLLQGFIETLQGGALNKPEDAQRFLDIMAKHAERLNAIIEDLLSLSRIEQDAERGQIVLEEGDLCEVLTSARNLCQAAADAKRIRLEAVCPAGLRARVNSRLLEQALVNLIDNAIKYSDPGTVVRLEGMAAGSEIVLAVQDQGPGIEAEHLPRLFERFYRVDKSRSRDAGGSGLGLAIVKHIVQAHGGTATVESKPGEGSTFSLHLPATPAG